MRTVIAIGVLLGGLGLITALGFMGSGETSSLNLAALSVRDRAAADAQQPADITLEQAAAAAAFLDTESIADNQKRVQHPTYGFTITVPNTMQLERYEEGGNSETLVFYDTDAEREFQLFITPYDEPDITQERLALDIPSGDIREPTEIVLGNGKRALMFWSQAPIVGETREVWFMHDGYLYEATAARELDAWLATILNTITFNTQ